MIVVGGNEISNWGDNMILASNGKQKFEHISSILHESKLVIFATDQYARVYYTVKQDGFEDTALDPNVANHTGWEAWKILDLPGAYYGETGHAVAETEDPSVLAKEKRENTFSDDPEKYVIRSRYTTHNHTARACSADLGVGAFVCVPSVAGWQNSGRSVCSRRDEKRAKPKIGGAFQAQWPAVCAFGKLEHTKSRTSQNG